MKLRKWCSIFLLFVLLLTQAAPVLATASEVPMPSQEEVPSQEEPESTLPEDHPQEGFYVQQFAETGDIFRTPPHAAMLIELNSGVTLYEMDPYERNFPASLTKIMTCWLALEYGNLDDVLTVSEEALQIDEAASTSGLVAGEQLTLRDMLYCVMLESANEACNVVAEYISGDIPTFVQLMNDTAMQLGCTGTHFVNTNGLHDEEHYTTAYDLSLITRAALENETFREISFSAKHTLPATEFHEEREISTTNKLMIDSVASGFYYSKARGVKTGFTTPAECCLISTAENGNMELLSIIMGAPLKEDENGNWIHRNFPESINLFEYGFDHFQIATVMSTLYPVAEIQVNQSAGAQTVALAPTSEVRTIIDAGFDPKEILLDVDLHTKVVDAPVEAGDIFGTVTVSYHGMILGHSDLAAITSVSRSEVSHRVDTTKHAVEDNWWKWLVGIVVAFVVLLAAYLIFLEIRRRQIRKRKVAARRRALEAQRRKQQFRDYFDE